MRSYSLQFKSAELERKYTQFALKDDVALYLQNQVLLIIISFVGALYSYGRGNIEVGYWLCIISVLLATQYQLVRRNNFLLEFSVCVNLVAVLLMQPVAFSISVNQGVFFDIDTFLVGQGYTFLFLSYGRYSKFHHKAMAILMNTVFQLIIKLGIQRQLSLSTMFWFVGTIMIILNLYQQDKYRRQAFLMKTSEFQWLQHLEQIGKVCTINCSHNAESIKLIFHHSNQIAQNNLGVEDQTSFLNMIRNLSVLERLNDATPPEFEKFNLKCKNLEHYLYSDDSQERMYYGLHNNNVYSINTFKTWNENLQMYHILMKRVYDPQEHGNIILNQTTFIEKYQLATKQTQSKLIKFFKSTGRYLKQKQISKLVDIYRINQNIAISMSNRYLRFQSGHSDAFIISSRKVDFCIAQSNLSSFIDWTCKIVLQQDQTPSKNKITNNVPLHLMISTDLRIMQMIILNILSHLLGQSNRVSINANCKSLCHPLHVITIIFRSHSFPYKETKKNLDFQIATYLTYMIGPYRQIIDKKKKECQITKVYLFQNLKDSPTYREN